MYRLCCLFFGAFLVTACGKSGAIVDSAGPLATVIKLNSAESFGDREAAIKYIDLEKVYDPTKYSDESRNLTAEELYAKYLDHLRVLRDSKKFSSEFPYHKYNIAVFYVSDMRAEVVFESEQQRIGYELDKVGGQWVVVGIVRRQKERT